LAEKLKEAGIRVIKIAGLERDVNFWRECRVFFALGRLFRQETPDIIHLNSSKIGGLGALAGRLMSRARLIFTAHGWAFNEERPRWQKSLIKFLQWLTVILVHKTIVISDREFRQMAGLLGTKKKLARIYNGVGRLQFADKDSARRELARLEPRLETRRYETWLGTIAELQQNKGLDLLIKALSKVTETHQGFLFVVIGEGEERKNLEALVQEYGLEKVIFLLGRVAEAAKYLKAFDIFTLTSRKEGLPYAVLEAGLAGLPVIATSVGGLPEIIKNNAQGLLAEPGDIEEIASSIRLLLDNPYLKQRLGVGLQAIIRQKFSLAEMLKRTLEVYRS
jgi:glycosyltransferase involved in cell wall biosynthesis